VTESLPDGAWAETRRTAYLTTGTPLRVDGEDRAVEVGALPGIERPLVVRPGDTIVLTADLSASPVGEGDRRRIGCTLPEVFDRVRVGDPIWFDDGRIGGVVTAVHPGEADVEVRSASPGGTKLRAEKGINLPDTDLGLGALTPDDTEALAFAAAHADLIALSFVQRPEDIELLQRELSARGGSDIGVILKIETKQGFARLPELLLAAMATERVGVMIARGDLAVECGFERLAEVQEEILWLCEAAHVPVIWATQVLDQLARTGQPSRAEITDAAMSERAECVMLNKGPHILEAIAVLDDILRRMSGHQQKKVPLLRQLRAWDPPVG
jgi:pyruvate kinase